MDKETDIKNEIEKIKEYFKANNIEYTLISDANFQIESFFQINLRHVVDLVWTIDIGGIVTDRHLNSAEHGLDTILKIVAALYSNDFDQNATGIFRRRYNLKVKIEDGHRMYIGYSKPLPTSLKKKIFNGCLTLIFWPFILTFIIFGSFDYYMFQIKCLFHPKQRYAFDELETQAKQELERLRSLSIAELKELHRTTIETRIHTRKAWIGREIHETESINVILIYRMLFMNWDNSMSQLYAIGFKIEKDNNRVDLSYDEIDEIVNL